MKDSIKIMGIIFLGLMVVLTVAFYLVEQHRHNSILTIMEETAKSASVTELDNSMRVEEAGTVELDKPDFEEKFKELFEANSNVNLTGIQYKFDYLEDSLGKAKALKIKVKDDRGSTYQIHLVANAIK